MATAVVYKREDMAADEDFHYKLWHCRLGHLSMQELMKRDKHKGMKMMSKLFEDLELFAYPDSDLPELDASVAMLLLARDPSVKPFCQPNHIE